MSDSSANDSLTPITTRRDFHKLALAALGGAVAGTLPGCGGQPAKPPDGKGADDKGAKDPATGGKSADSKSPEKPATTDENLLLAGDPHVCRGLNQCKGQAKGKDNACAGQGACASADKHSCDGMNACKGQGGCGEHPGQNQCNGQGACAVPLKDNTWTKARKKFEELMAKKGKAFGSPPEKA